MYLYLIIFLLSLSFNGCSGTSRPDSHIKRPEPATTASITQHAANAGSFSILDKVLYFSIFSNSQERDHSRIDHQETISFQLMDDPIHPKSVLIKIQSGKTQLNYSLELSFETPATINVYLEFSFVQFSFVTLNSDPNQIRIFAKPFPMTWYLEKDQLSFGLTTILAFEKKDSIYTFKSALLGGRVYTDLPRNFNLKEELLGFPDNDLSKSVGP